MKDLSIFFVIYLIILLLLIAFIIILPLAWIAELINIIYKTLKPKK